MKEAIKSMTVQKLQNLRTNLLIKRMRATSKEEWDKLVAMSNQVAAEIESR